MELVVLGEMLGEGSFANVYRDTTGLRAIKVFKQLDSDPEKGTRMSLYNAEMAKINSVNENINSPDSPRSPISERVKSGLLTGEGRTAKVDKDPQSPVSPVIVMPLCQGRSMSDILKGKNPELVKTVLMGLVSLVKDMHACGITHNDISLNNVMYCAVAGTGESTRLIDFGSAAVLKNDMSFAGFDDKHIGSPPCVHPLRLLKIRENKQPKAQLETNMDEAFRNRFLHCQTDPEFTTALYSPEENKAIPEARKRRMDLISKTYLRPYLAWCVDAYWRQGDKTGCDGCGKFTFDGPDNQVDFSKECDTYAVLALACLSFVYNNLSLVDFNKIIEQLNADDQQQGGAAKPKPKFGTLPEDGSESGAEKAGDFDTSAIPEYMGNINLENPRPCKLLGPGGVAGGGSPIGPRLSAALALASAAAAALLLVVST